MKVQFAHNALAAKVPVDYQDDASKAEEPADLLAAVQSVKVIPWPRVGIESFGPAGRLFFLAWRSAHRATSLRYDAFA